MRRRRVNGLSSAATPGYRGTTSHKGTNMGTCQITSWEYVPDAEDEAPCFMTYKFTGTHDGQPFCCKVAMEIDGRDMEFDHISGVNMDVRAGNEYNERWDDLLAAFDTTPGLNEDMEKRGEPYYGAD